MRASDAERNKRFKKNRLFVTKVDWYAQSEKTKDAAQLPSKPQPPEEKDLYRDHEEATKGEDKYRTHLDLELKGYKAPPKEKESTKSMLSEVLGAGWFEEEKGDDTPADTATASNA